MSKTTVEECRRLSIYGFKWQLYPGCVGTATWSNRERTVASMGFQVMGERLPTGIRLFYTITSPAGETEEHDHLVALTTTPLPWRGSRYWFLCPFWGCERRVAYLYMAPGRPFFACRQCHNLDYESQHRHNALGRLLRRIDVWADAS